MLHGTNPPPASPEAIQKAQECSRLQSEAGFEWRAAVNALETDQCGKDADCDPWALYTSDYPAYMERTFQSDRDACWASCSATPGAPEYAGALRDIAARACADFRAAGCPVYPAGCVPVEPVALTCVDGVCQP